MSLTKAELETRVEELEGLLATALEDGKAQGAMEAATALATATAKVAELEAALSEAASTIDMLTDDSAKQAAKITTLEAALEGAQGALENADSDPMPYIDAGTIPLAGYGVVGAAQTIDEAWRARFAGRKQYVTEVFAEEKTAKFIVHRSGLTASPIPGGLRVTAKTQPQAMQLEAEALKHGAQEGVPVSVWVGAEDSSLAEVRQASLDGPGLTRMGLLAVRATSARALIRQDGKVIRLLLE